MKSKSAYRSGDLVVLLDEKRTLAIYITPYSKHGYYHKLWINGGFFPYSTELFRHA